MDGGAGLAGSMTPDDAAHDPRGPEVVLVVDSGHVVRSASPSAATAFSVPADKLDDTPLFDLVYRGDRSRLNDALLHIQRDPSNPQSLAVRVLYDLPRAPWAELTVQPLHTGAADSIVVTIRPFLIGATQEPAPTPTVSATALVQNSSDIVLVTDPDGIVRFANTAMLRTLGARPDELFASQILDILHADDHDSVTAAMVRVLEHPDKVARVEMRARRADGSYGGSRARSATCSTTPRSAASSATAATSPIAGSPRPPSAPARSASGRSRRRRRAPSSSATSTATSPTPTTVVESPVATSGSTTPCGR